MFYIENKIKKTFDSIWKNKSFGGKKNVILIGYSTKINLKVPGQASIKTYAMKIYHEKEILIHKLTVSVSGREASSISRGSCGSAELTIHT